MSSSYYVIFRGEIAEGFTTEQVKKQLASLLEKDDETIEKLFSGRTLIIKKDASLRQCQKIRDVFRAAGAICLIRQSKGRTEGAITDKTTGPTRAANPRKQTSTDTFPHNVRQAKVGKPVTSATHLKEHVEKYKHAITNCYSEAVKSIKSDIETGGTQLLIKNKYFLCTIAAFLLLAAVLTFNLVNGRKTMPINQENLTTIAKHVVFIENAFTIEELRATFTNPQDFLNYLLADPITKMGYQFDATIKKIAHLFLKDNLSQNELEKIKPYLKITVHERNRLLKHDCISKSVHSKLEAVSKKMAP